jgi:group I intron endonuclease
VCNLPGIYVLRNKNNGKIYVGQSRVNVDKRSKHHGGHRIQYINRVVDKHGLENFDRFIYYVPEELLDDLERDMIKNLHSLKPDGYNIDTGGCKNKYLSEETKKKISDAHRGKKLSEEHKKKISDAEKGRPSPMRGRILSEEHKTKIGMAFRGRVSPLRGRTLSEEHKRKISMAEQGQISPLRGRSLSEEHKRKLSEIGKGKPGPNRGLILPRDNWGRYIRRAA